ncbi:UNVERIFIED_CONTAM: hypothetical protein FQV16_0014560, partial [Eudyptes robustus]
MPGFSGQRRVVEGESDARTSGSPQALWGDCPLRTILDWAISFLQRRLSAWIQRQGGWVSVGVSPMGG